MIFSTMMNQMVLLLAASATAASIPGVKRATQICFDETPELHCYSEPDDVPQDVTVDDVKFIAAYLRSYGRQTRAGRLFTMKAADAPDCGEWSLYARGTAAAYAKHLNNTVDSSVLFEDIATTIDGGETTAAHQASIVDCLTEGGSLGVLVNSTNAAYSAATYTSAGYTPQGILIKIVSGA
ncbi:hypothetical protein F4821DRAFT_262617 [Hypoxylon rubiginosum]|uniref:Uncharacterized protein n=1 Tax=Hypoxylon rubiginosum TaxID=110542 RepID=A0ACC0CTB8_9PEZI|nr:hypothetical protein F4821DRAFT_262617 [Hypoxylon rubiginosum]